MIGVFVLGKMVCNCLAKMEGQVKSFKFLHSENTSSPMLVTLSGIVTLVRLLHHPNASSPMLVTLSGIVTLVSFLHPLNALLPLFLTSAVRQRMRWSKSRVFVPSALVTPFAFFVHPLTHGLRRKGCDSPYRKTRRFVCLMLSVYGSRKQKTYKT